VLDSGILRILCCPYPLHRSIPRPLRFYQCQFAGVTEAIVADATEARDILGSWAPCRPAGGKLLLPVLPRRG
jgi:hypothetical protein